MRPTTAFARLALCLGAVTSVAASSWWEDMHLVPRQNDGGDGTDGSDGAAPTDGADGGDGGDGGDGEDTADITPTDDAEAPEETGDGENTTRRLNTASTLDPDAPRPTKTGSGRKGNSTEKEEFDVSNPVAGIVMITPNIFLGPPLYKAGDFVTWEWNYTNLLGTPTAIDLLLACQTPKQTWTLTANKSFEEVGKYTWDSRVQQTMASQPLLTEKYELHIKDSDSDPDDPDNTPAPGYLPPNGATFGMAIYTPQDYTPLSDWNCATCSFALEGLEQRAVGFAVTMGLITVGTFTWFVTGLNL